MSAKQYFPIAVFIAVQTFLLQIADQLLSPLVHPPGNSGFCWMAFQAWAVYFLAGGAVKEGLRSLCSYIIGMLVAICIINGIGMIDLGFFTVPSVMFVMVIILLQLERGPQLINFIPPVFVGAGAYFACMTYIPGTTLQGMFVTEVIYCSLGLFCGWMTVAFRSWYEPRLKLAEPK
jgi:hypothetical protein